jgi:galactoside O-acetyltransferase
MSWREKINGGGIYFCTDDGYFEEQAACLEKLYDFNQTRPGEHQKRSEILRGFFGRTGENLYIEPPLHANWGRNTYWGDYCYANFNLTLIDDGEIHIGSRVMFAPNVVVSTAGHPINPDLRRKTAQFSVPVYIGDNVWIGANAVILPGVHIGKNSVIGAGSVVTKDIPANVVAVGNPCRVMRPISEYDMQYYRKGMKIDV